MTIETDDLVRGFRWAVATAKVSADNPNCLAPVSIAEAEAGADTIERLQSSLAERTDYALAADLKIAALQGRLAACQCALKEKP